MRIREKNHHNRKWYASYGNQRIRKSKKLILKQKLESPNPYKSPKVFRNWREEKKTETRFKTRIH